MVRPGAAIYGIAPQKNQPNPMRQVIYLKGKIVQVRQIGSGKAVGYGATYRASQPSRIATVAVGYGDGYPCHLSNRGHGYLNGISLPVVGRISMDLITFDVSSIPEDAVQPGLTIDLLNDSYTADDLAHDAETIGYEILTNLGNRYERRYIGAIK